MDIGSIIQVVQVIIEAAPAVLASAAGVGVAVSGLGYVIAKIPNPTTKKIGDALVAAGVNFKGIMESFKKKDVEEKK